MRIVILGGHGKVALLLTALLAEAGHHVDSVIRNPGHADEVAGTGGTPVVADLETLDTDAMTDLLRGQDAVIWSAGAGGGNPKRTYAVDRDAAIRSMDAAVRAGVERYVMVSYSRSGRDHVDPDHPFFPYADAKATADAQLRQTPLNWTILGPSTLTDGDGTGLLEAGDHVTCGDTARANVARVALQALVRSDLGGVALNFRDGSVPIAEVLETARL